MTCTVVKSHLSDAEGLVRQQKRERLVARINMCKRELAIAKKNLCFWSSELSVAVNQLADDKQFIFEHVFNQE